MNKRNVLILAEGYEEKPYIEKIIHFPCMSDSIVFEPVINLKGNGQIISRYQYELQTNRYDMVLIFADADKGSKQFIELIEKLGLELFGDKSKGKLVFMFANPVTMQIVLSHFGKVELNSNSKKINSNIIYGLTGILNYDAKEKQIKELIGKVNYRNYPIMKENIKELPTEYKKVPSSNFLEFLTKFESHDNSWIDEINSQILNY